MDRENRSTLFHVLLNKKIPPSPTASLHCAAVESTRPFVVGGTLQLYWVESLVCAHKVIRFLLQWSDLSSTIDSASILAYLGNSSRYLLCCLRLGQDLSPQNIFYSIRVHVICNFGKNKVIWKVSVSYTISVSGLRLPHPYRLVLFSFGVYFFCVW